MNDMPRRLKPYFLLKILEEYTDENHHLKMEELREKFLRYYPEKPERKGLYDDFAALEAMGLQVRGDNVYDKKYQLKNRLFTISELKLMVDSLQASKFLPAEDSLALIQKLETLCSIYQKSSLQRAVITNNKARSFNEESFENIDGLFKAINADMQVKFKYFNFDISGQRKYFKNGNYYVVSPWAMIYSDDNYYLLAYDAKERKPEKRMKHFRVDRMSEVATVEELRLGKEEFDQIDLAQYQKYTFNMYGGKVEKVTLAFTNDMMGTVMDRFGHNVMVYPVDGWHFQTTVSVAVSPQFFGWLFGLGKKARIVAPEHVKQQMKEHLADVSSKYE